MTLPSRRARPVCREIVLRRPASRWSCARSPPTSTGSIGTSCRRSSCRDAGTSYRVQRQHRDSRSSVFYSLSCLRRPVARWQRSARPARDPGRGRALLGARRGRIRARGYGLRPHGWLIPDEEPRRRPDPRLGWTLVPDRVGQKRIGGRPVDYAIDPAGYRVRRARRTRRSRPPDAPLHRRIRDVRRRPGLGGERPRPGRRDDWIQSANLAVHGFSTDQAYLRLQIELPRFRRPVAVVSLFMTALFGRNLDEDRPHLGPASRGLPAEQSASRSRWPSSSCRTAATRRSIAASR